MAIIREQTIKITVTQVRKGRDTSMGEEPAMLSREEIATLEGTLTEWAQSIVGPNTVVEVE